MTKLAQDTEWKVEDTVSQANQLDPGLTGHAIAHYREIEPRAPPSNAVC